jgi:succinate dehydrogenase / fumarate reductase cytochrome b subunit
MLVSILHRVAGDGLAIVGGVLLTWWLLALASGPASYGAFLYYIWSADAGDTTGIIVNWLARIVLIGLSWAFFQHLFSGLRHLVLDMGAGYELKTNRRWSQTVVASALLATIILWVWLLLGRAV